MAVLVSCITILPYPKVDEEISLEQHKCLSIYRSAIIKKCNYEKNQRHCYEAALKQMRSHIYEECGVVIN